jgi:hypothetical protein
MGKETLINIKGPFFPFVMFPPTMMGTEKHRMPHPIVNGRGCTTQLGKANEMFAMPRSCRRSAYFPTEDKH